MSSIEIEGKDPTVDRVPWLVFRDLGLLRRVNRFLNPLGVAICLEVEISDGTLVDAYPIKVVPDVPGAEPTMTQLAEGFSRLAVRTDEREEELGKIGGHE